MTSLSLQDQMFLQRASKNLPKRKIDEFNTAGANLVDGNMDNKATKGMKIAGGPKKKFDADTAGKGGQADMKEGSTPASEQGHGKKAMPGQQITREGEQLDEFTFKLNPKKKGMWKGKNISQIEKAKTKAKKSGNVTKEREAQFAINAKHHFHKEDEQLDELSKKTLGSYVKKARWDVMDLTKSKSTLKKGKMSPKNADRTRTNRNVGISHAVDKLTKESAEEFNENQPKFAREGGALDAAEQGWGKKQLGKEGGTSGTSAGPAAEQGHGKKAVTGELDRKEEVEQNQPEIQEKTDPRAEKIWAKKLGLKSIRKSGTVKSLSKKEELEMAQDEVLEADEGDARGQGGHPTGKETLGPVRIKADGSPGPAAEQGHGKKPVTGEIYRDGHEGSAGELSAKEGQGKNPILGVICREDVQELLAAIMDEKPGEALDAFSAAIAPAIVEYVAAYKEYIQEGLLGVEEDMSDVAYDAGDELEVDDDDSQKNDEEIEEEDESEVA